VKAGAASRARSQYIATAKAPCQAFTAAALNFFFGKTRASFFQADADAECQKFRRTSEQRDFLGSALHQSSE